MLNTKHSGRYSRMREMRDDLSIIVGAQRSRQQAAASQLELQHQPMSQSPYWSNCSFGRTANSSPQGTMFQNLIQRPSVTSPPVNTTIDCLPRLATAAQCRTAASRLRCPQPPTSRWGIISSPPVIRRAPTTPVPIPHQSRPYFSNRTPMSSIFRHVQRPPQTPLNSLPATSNNEILLQSPWVNRDLAATVIRTKTFDSTSQLSIQELIDVLCQEGVQGKGKPSPATSSVSGSSSRLVSNNRMLNSDELSRNQGFALGTVRMSRKPKSTPLKPSTNSSTILSEYPSACRPRKVRASRLKTQSFLNLSSLSDDESDADSSFFSTEPSDQSSPFLSDIFPTPKLPSPPGGGDVLKLTINVTSDSGNCFNFTSTSDQSADSVNLQPESPASKRRCVIRFPERDIPNLANGFTNDRHALSDVSFSSDSDITNQPSSNSSILSQYVGETGLPKMSSQSSPRDFLNLTRGQNSSPTDLFNLNGSKDFNDTSLDFSTTSPALFEDTRRPSFVGQREYAKRKMTFFDEITDSPRPSSQPLF